MKSEKRLLLHIILYTQFVSISLYPDIYIKKKFLMYTCMNVSAACFTKKLCVCLHIYKNIPLFDKYLEKYIKNINVKEKSDIFEFISRFIVFFLCHSIFGTLYFFSTIFAFFSVTSRPHT